MPRRVFIYEYTCGSGAADPALSFALQVEGWAMLSTLLEDFGRISGVETLTLLDEHCAHDSLSGVCRRIRAQDEERVFRELAAAADCTLVIAPELDDILLTRCRWVVQAGGRLLGPSLATVELTGDKLALSRHLRKRGLFTPESRPFVPSESVSPVMFPLVCKPRNGAGSQATFLVHDQQELRTCLDRARAERWQGEALLQPFVPGRPASVAFLTGPYRRVPLLAAAQRLSQDGRFHYLGGTVPLPDDLGTRAVNAARRALETLVDLRGYIGVDVVLGPAEDGSEDAVIEINPRPTTSYVGLRALAETNLAETWLQVAFGDEPPHLVWRSGVVQFDADGTVQWRS
jgi:predicted ATP-grasp superfamily ATP-dependent carboligase